MSLADEVAWKSFRGATGGTEHFIAVNVPARLDFDLGQQIERIEAQYAAALRSLDLRAESAIARRLFVSDVMNQATTVCRSTLFHDEPHNPVAVSLVQQPPLSGTKIALLAYHVEGGDPARKTRLSPNNLLIERKGGQRHLWTTGLCAAQTDPDPSPAVQTRKAFGDLIGALAREGGTLRDHCVRTWIYLKDVDTFYAGMVEARGEIFAEQGLTADTHFIASTGIQGACAHRHDLVSMDAYSNLDLRPAQVSYLNDFERLCATHDYNVHFERGTRIAYADRSHHFISGTASIDKRGMVVHEGDVMRQLEHTLQNIDALLRSGTAGLADLTHLIVYLRDPADYGRVDALLRERLPDVPTVIVNAAVCRPEWLIEIEGVAVVANDAPMLPSF